MKGLPWLYDRWISFLAGSLRRPSSLLDHQRAYHPGPRLRVSFVIATAARRAKGRSSNEHSPEQPRHSSSSFCGARNYGAIYDNYVVQYHSASQIA